MKKVLSVLLSLMMVLSMFSIVSFAEGANVAEVGGTEYATLAEAIDAANNGDTINLLADIALTGTQEIHKSLTINGNNKTITVTGGSAANKIYYALYVVDSEGEAITVNVNDLTLNTTGYQVAFMVNCDYNSEATLNNVVISCDGAAVYSNGFALVSAVDCDFTRRGKYVEGKDAVYYSCINVGYGGSVDMTNSTITAYGGNGVGTFPSGGTVTLTGVDINVEQDDESGMAAGHALWSRNEDYTNLPDYLKDSTIIVNSGNVNGDFFITDKYTSGDKNKYDPIISITGGTFDNDPTAYVAEGYDVIDNQNGTWTVCNAAAEVNGVKYATLAEAFAAANAIENATVTLLGDYDMETNEPGYGYTTSYVANGETTPRNNMIAISGTGLTFDLGGHTLSNLYNNTFTVTGENVTIKNGTMQLGQLYYGKYNTKTGAVTAYGPAYGSYVVYVNGATNFVVEDLVTFGGINVAGGSTATINDLSFSGLSFYAVCSQEGSTVTLNGGSYDKSIPGAASTLFWIESGSAMNITDGTFTKGSTQFINTKSSVKPVITGGTFDFDPTNFGVAEGYEAVLLNNGRYQVGEIQASTIAPADVTEGYDATYTANKEVISTDGAETVLSSENSIKVNVKAVTDGTAASNTTVDKVKVEDVIGEVIQAAPSGANEINIQIEVVRDDPEVVVDGNKSSITYEVHPVASAYSNNELIGTVQINNSSLSENASFTVVLPVPAALATTGRVKVTHISEGYNKEVASYEVQGDSVNGYYITLNVTHFSQFELEVDELNSTGTANWGATLTLEDAVVIKLYVGNLKNAFGSTETDPGRFKVAYTYHGVRKEVALTNAVSNRIVVAVCAAKELADVVNLELYYDDVLIDSVDYSARKYCDDKIAENTDANLVELCYALLEYGSYAQVRFQYNTEDLANINNYRDHSRYVDIPSGYDLDASGYYNVVAQIGASLSLNSKTEVNVYFMPLAGFSAEDYTVTVDGTPATIISTNTGSQTICKVNVHGIAAKDLGTNVNVVISNGLDSFTLHYSPMTYAVMKWNDSIESDISRALYCYHLAAKAYFAQ